MHSSIILPLLSFMIDPLMSACLENIDVAAGYGLTGTGDYGCSGVLLVYIPIFFTFSLTIRLHH